MYGLLCYFDAKPPRKKLNRYIFDTNRTAFYNSINQIAELQKTAKISLFKGFMHVIHRAFNRWHTAC